jgi:hypothetical protein
VVGLRIKETICLKWELMINTFITSYPVLGVAAIFLLSELLDLSSMKSMYPAFLFCCVTRTSRITKDLILQDQLRRESKRSKSGGIPFMYVLLVGLIGLILGYIMKRT